MHCGQRHLIGMLNDTDKVRKIPKDELVQIITTIRSDYAMKDAEICQKDWFKKV